MKKWLPWVALILCALLLLAVIGVGIWLLKLVNRANNAPTVEKQTVEAYFQSEYSDFTFVSYDSETQSVTLQKKVDHTYELVSSFGKESYEQLALGHLDTMKIMQIGCESACDVQLHTITVQGISSDEKVIYTVHSDGSMEACWD